MFDLENAIKKWKQKLAANQAMEEGYIAELEGHLRDRVEELTGQGVAAQDAFEQVVEAMGNADETGSEFFKAHTVRRSDRPPWQPPRFMPALLWNYLKTALRKIGRSKGYSFINVIGLSMGLACFALIMMWVRDEVSWERSHENLPLIHRLESNSPAMPAALAPYLKANYAEIADAVRFYRPYPPLVKNLDKAFEEAGFVLADPSVFNIFTIPFIAGNRAGAFTDPDTVVLTESAAKKYFGNENPIDSFLTVEDRIQVRITGIVQDPPRNSDLQFAILGNFKILRYFNENYESNWGNRAYFTYVKLAPSAAAAAVIHKIAHLIMDHDPAGATALTMTALGRIHLYQNGVIETVVTFTLIAFFILLVAACNFVNLATARAGKRAKEIAVRKVAGATRIQLVKQFLSESVLLALGAFLVSLAIVVPVLPAFNAITGKAFRPANLLEPGVFLLLLGTAVVIGVLSGAYPALLLSSFRPAGLLKDTGFKAGRSSGSSLFRKILVVTQFSISIVLLISTLFIARQVAFVRNYNLGIQKENIVYLPAKAPLIKSGESFIRELTSQPGIVNATFVSSLPSQVANVADGMEWEGMAAGLKPAWAFVATDDRYLDTLGITLVEGRNFPEATPVKDAPYFIVNQKAVREMKLKNPVGTRFSMWDWNGIVLGVVKDFHFRSLHEDIQPLLLFVLPKVYGQILVKIRPESGPNSEVIARVKKVWEKFAPGIPFSYEFLDSAFAGNYQAEQNMELEFKYFAFLGIFIACLGLFGLAAALAEQKRKEIGIRKVFGATMADILRHVNREFLGPVVLANLIAWPLAFWAMSKWLQEFAYHTKLSFDLFLLAAISTLLIALLTVSYQTVRAARANPVDSLRYE
ncbi:MAG TPA: FtsX-like permease family protein [Patescibacteria group bacterium]|nr:FtsX-like permease family protein [Patescibacteria group bacterium]